MSEPERSESFGTPMSSDDAAELEQLRREAAVLREQLEQAVGPDSGLRSARDVHQLEARIDSLAARNAKLMDTLKEARQQLLALREEVDRLGQPPSGYGVLLGDSRGRHGRRVHLGPQDATDLLAEHRVTELKQGQTVRLNEALTVVEAGNFESVGEISTLREILADGHRALVVGHADEERIVWLAEPLVATEFIDDDVDERSTTIAAAQAAARRLAAGRHQGRLRVRAHPQGRGRGSGPGRGSRRQLRGHRRP